MKNNIETYRGWRQQLKESEVTYKPITTKEEWNKAWEKIFNDLHERRLEETRKETLERISKELNDQIDKESKVILNMTADKKYYPTYDNQTISNNE